MNNNLSACLSSERMDWETPQQFFDKLNKEFNFQLDVCANSKNAKCDLFFSEETDGLIQSWKNKVCWMNPPYGREIGKWIKKAYEESQNGATVVCLIPSRTDTAYWHDYVMRASEIRYVRGRLKFVGANSSAPFPSAVIIFKGV